MDPGAATPALLLALVTAARELVLRGQLKRQDFEAKSRGVQLEALYDVGLAIASTLDFERLCEEILMRAVSLSDARRGALYLMQKDSFDLHRAFGGDAQARLDPGEDETQALLAGTPRPTCCVLPGALYVLGVPVAVDGLPKGLLVIGDKESRQGVGPFSPADRRTLDLLANQAAIALENADLHRQALEKERLEREIELASEIQRQILPKGTPDIPGYELAGWNRPARHIGGDYYDFFPFDDGRSWGLVLADVSGKGVPAALLVSTLHSALRLLLDRLELGSDLFARLNDHILASSAANKFITLLAARLETESGVLPLPQRRTQSGDPGSRARWCRAVRAWWPAAGSAAGRELSHRAGGDRARRSSLPLQRRHHGSGRTGRRRVRLRSARAAARRRPRNAARRSYAAHRRRGQRARRPPAAGRRPDRAARCVARRRGMPLPEASRAPPATG